MNIFDILRSLFIEGYASINLTMRVIIGCILCTLLLAGYIFFIYKRINKNSFYNKNFNISLIALAVITAAVILTIQSNIVVSLGMVGALSIVRFRTAIKDPLDLVFLFWSISVGIICGAGFAAIALVASLALTVVIIALSNMREFNESMILVVNADGYNVENGIMEVVGKYCDNVQLRAKNITKNDMNMAIEVKIKNQQELMKQLMEMENITSVSLVGHDGDVTV